MPVINVSHRMHFLSGLVLLASSWYSTARSESSPDPIDILGRFKKSSDWTETMAMDVDSETLIAGGSNPGHRRQKMVYRRDGDRAETIRHDCLLGRTGTLGDGEELTEADFSREKTYIGINLVNGECHLGASMFAGGTRYTATVQRQDYADNFEHNHDTLTSGDFLEGAFSVGNGTDHIADALAGAKDLQVSSDQIGDVPCYMLKGTLPPYGRVTAWIAPDKGFTAMKYVIQKDSTDLIAPGRPLADIGLSSWTITVDTTDLAEIDGVFVPVGGRYTHESIRATGEVKTTSVRVKRSNVQLDPDFEAMGAFQIDLPEGTPIHLAEAPGIRYIWSNGQIVTDMNSLWFEDFDKVFADSAATEQFDQLAQSGEQQLFSSPATGEIVQTSSQAPISTDHADSRSPVASTSGIGLKGLICIVLLPSALCGLVVIKAGRRKRDAQIRRIAP